MTLRKVNPRIKRLGTPKSTPKKSKPTPKKSRKSKGPSGSGATGTMRNPGA